MQGARPEGVGCGVEECGYVGGRGEGRQEGREEGCVVAAAGFNEKFAGGCAVGVCHGSGGLVYIEEVTRSSETGLLVTFEASSVLFVGCLEIVFRVGSYCEW